ncbi:MAG: lipoate--protein ligase family protein [Hadesarchaea archaeon]|nr:lipoate--protein ligase family protein [Hadesarchaea archaeon]
MRIDDPFTSMAIDESILRLNAQGEAPNTIRFWRWEPSTVSLGRFQSLSLEIDQDSADRHNVSIVRRISGGGSVFHDHSGELTYSVICSEDEVSNQIIESYKMICGGLVRGFEELGLEAEYSPVNDVLVNGKKISGSAQTRQKGSILQHGTILIDPDIQKMFEVLKVSKEKISDKFIKSVYQRVTSVKRELGETPSFEKVREAMISGFKDIFSVGFFEEELNSKEQEMITEFYDKYSSREWTGKR